MKRQLYTNHHIAGREGLSQQAEATVAGAPGDLAEAAEARKWLGKA
jgi:hypothetical protein